jgi:hypothetical protein
MLAALQQARLIAFDLNDRNSPACWSTSPSSSPP